MEGKHYKAQSSGFLEVNEFNLPSMVSAPGETERGGNQEVRARGRPYRARQSQAPPQEEEHCLDGIGRRGCDLD